MADQLWLMTRIREEEEVDQVHRCGVFTSIVVQVPFRLCLRLWDVYMLDGERLLVTMSYNLLKMHQSPSTFLLVLYTALMQAEGLYVHRPQADAMGVHVCYLVVFVCVKSSQLCCLNWACWKDLGCACWKEPFSVADCKSCKFTTKNEVKSKFIESGIFATKLLPRNLRDPSHTAAVFGRSLKTFLRVLVYTVHQRHLRRCAI